MSTAVATLRAGEQGPLSLPVAIDLQAELQANPEYVRLLEIWYQADDEDCHRSYVDVENFVSTWQQKIVDAAEMFTSYDNIWISVEVVFSSEGAPSWAAVHHRLVDIEEKFFIPARNFSEAIASVLLALAENQSTENL